MKKRLLSPELVEAYCPWNSVVLALDVLLALENVEVAFVIAASTVVEILSGTIRLEITGGAADNTETPEVATAEDSEARASAPDTLAEAASIDAWAKFALNVVAKVDPSFAV